MAQSKAISKPRFTILFLTREEFLNLPEYNHSPPTGKQKGFRWKHNIYRVNPSRNPTWYVCEYEDDMPDYVVHNHFPNHNSRVPPPVRIKHYVPVVK